MIKRAAPANASAQHMLGDHAQHMLGEYALQLRACREHAKGSVTPSADVQKLIRSKEGACDGQEDLVDGIEQLTISKDRTDPSLKCSTT